MIIGSLFLDSSPPDAVKAWVTHMAKRFGMESTIRPRGRPKGSREKTPAPFFLSISRAWGLPFQGVVEAV